MRTLTVLNSETALTIGRQLTTAGYEPFNIPSGSDALVAASASECDCIISDYRPEDMSSVDLIEALRANRIKANILVLDNDDHWKHAVECLDAGADDYLGTPRQEELPLRLAALRRRVRVVRRCDRHGRLTIDFDRREVTVDGRPVPFVTQEYRMFEALADVPGIPLSQQALFSRIYGDEPRESSLVRIIVSRMRAKLTAALGAPAPIEVVWGHGYRFCPQT